MNTRLQLAGRIAALTIVALSVPFAAFGQVPVDDNGKAIGDFERASATADTGNEDIPLLGATELEELVGPIALYPDDLLAIVLPASAYPLQIIEAGRFLEELENDSSLEPDPEWDDSVVALLNYPEVIELLNEDIDWTWRLGEAVVAQQGDVVLAIESFRDRAYAAGNLHSDDYQTVERNDGVIEITPVAEDVIYVPYYEPERVVVYQPRPVYYYYPRAYPVYYYPYPSSYYFDNGFFWGVTTAFTIGWISDSLHVYHHSYRGHPYYGFRYRDYWWYRRPSISVYNTTYVRNTNVTVNHYYNGDRWRPRNDRRNYVRATEPRVINHQRNATDRRIREARQPERREAIRFRSRPEATAHQRSNASPRLERRDKAVPQRMARNDATARQRAQRVEPTARLGTQRREPVTTQGNQRREPAAKQRAERRVPGSLQRTERRETVARQRTERREPAATQRVERREPVARQRIERREPVARQRAERREPVARQRNESRRTEPSVQRETRQASRRAEPERREQKRSEPREKREARSNRENRRDERQARR